MGGWRGDIEGEGRKRRRGVGWRGGRRLGETSWRMMGESMREAKRSMGTVRVYTVFESR